MKALTTKILSIVFIIALVTGCASSVTDAGLDQQTDPNASDVHITMPNPDTNGETEIEPIIPKPTSGEEGDG